MRTRALVWIGAGVLGASVLAGAARAADVDARRFHSERFGYSFSVPEGWALIPADQASKLAAALARSGMEGVGVDAGFYKESGSGFGYPYVLVIVSRYTVDREPTDAEMRLVVKTRKKQFPNVIQAKYSPASKSFTWEYRVDVPQLGRLHVLSVGYFGRAGLVEVMGYSMENGFGEAQPAFKRMQGSFAFDAGVGHSGRTSGSKRLWMWLGIGLGVVVLIAIVRRLR